MLISILRAVDLAMKGYLPNLLGDGCIREACTATVVDCFSLLFPMYGVRSIRVLWQTVYVVLYLPSLWYKFCLVGRGDRSFGGKMEVKIIN
ncbi:MULTISPECIES: hypothetical protein [unclassified Microcoleus]|uniref:hypothetical protein n=2 Tax=unclassified Microcoleus TaxID=2642155 RepID=UPI002FD0783D